MDEYRMNLTVEVYKSPLQEGWYARVVIEGGEVADPGQQLTGRGNTAIAATQSALSQLAAGAVYQQMLLETALMRGTRTAKRLADGKAKK